MEDMVIHVDWSLSGVIEDVRQTHDFGETQEEEDYVSLLPL